MYHVDPRDFGYAPAAASRQEEEYESDEEEVVDDEEDVVPETAEEQTKRILRERPKAQLRHFRFTQWNVDVDPRVIYGPYCSFLACQIEKCPNTGRLHVQGYAQCKRNIHYATIYKLNPIVMSEDGAHVVSGSWLLFCDASSETNINYATKEATRVSGPWIVGTPRSYSARRGYEATGEKKRGKKPSTDKLANMLAEIFEGTFVREENEVLVARYQSYYNTAVARVEELERAKRRFTDTVVFIHAGVSRAGKTYNAERGRYEIRNGKYELVAHDHPQEDCFVVTNYCSSSRHPWFDGYTGQKRIVFNEITPDKICWASLLEITDVNPCIVQTKGGHVRRNWSEIHFTSNVHPLQWYPGKDMSPLFLRMRRDGRPSGRTIIYQSPHVTQGPEAVLTVGELFALTQ